jgi:hypothetical protein
MKPSTIPEQYATEPQRSAYMSGYGRGHGIACHNVPRVGDAIDRTVDYVGCGRTVTSENAAEYHELLCFAAEANGREYSPFEFTAHELNEYGEGTDDSPSADEMWEAFDAGIADAIRADLATYTADDYAND